MTKTVTPSLVRRIASSQAYERGLEYHRAGMVRCVVHREGVIEARVDGSGPRPYRIEVTDDVETKCSCPYDQSGACKHIVAVLLHVLQSPRQIERRPGLKELLDPLSKEDLRGLVERLVDRGPDALEVLEQALSPQAGVVASGGSFKNVARRVQNTIHSLNHLRPSEAYWHVDGVLAELRSVLKEIKAAVHTEPSADVLGSLTTFTQAYCDEWFVLDGSDGTTGDFWFEIAETWLEALVAAHAHGMDLDPWEKRIVVWSEEISDYGLEEAFLDVHAFFEALEDQDGPEDWPEAVVNTRLKQLESAGDLETALSLAIRTGHRASAGVLLARMGRTAEAEKEADLVDEPEDLLRIAQALADASAHENAVRVAGRGFHTKPVNPDLMDWLASKARDLGDVETAKKAARAALDSWATHSRFARLKSFEGEDWDRTREEVLEGVLRANPGPADEKTRILVAEGELHAAVQIARRQPHEVDLRFVMDAAMDEEVELDWVAEQAIKEAGQIMDRKDASRYAVAIDWLERAKQAYGLQDRVDQWDRMLEGILRKHSRKYKLVPMLKRLR